ncbi:MFS transporter [Actinacidiphila bryophytorum]|uniref:MFS transporter n=1 Tax=Actinacidiphila bryophytorum TaxID=1436133 RepID=A0A9W4EDU2_9ACTN|nr:MFS transporter [Actinacidiphila bryophytorum]MBM9434785.1 MFS transporter [Actinacidiphila bryophytorum]MBN6545798.1 MFS transporter [Actinacidiphila bryophytorum]CAG7630139.1 MFS transporter [Actinacidiphila bryophytorum]
MQKRYALRRHLAGAVAARTGDEMSGPALLLAGFALAGSAVDASSLLACITVSAAVGGPVLGALLDRAGRPGRLLASALALYAAGLGAILLGLGRLPFAATLAVAVVTGLLGPALSGGWTAQLADVVRSEDLSRATTFDAMTFGAATLAGPALAGVAAQTLGAPTAVLAAAALIATAVPAAWLLPARHRGAPDAGPSSAGSPADRPAGPGPSDAGFPHAPPGTGSSGAGSSVVRDLAAGMRVIAGRPALARATFTSVVCCVAQGMLVACVPLLGAEVLGGAGRGAVLLSCTAVSGLAANAVLARFPLALAPDTIVRAGALVQAAALALAAAGGPAVLVVAALVAGVGEGPQLAALFAVRHRESPDRLRGQIFTTGASMKTTGYALGAAVAGPPAARSLTAALSLAAGVAALAALAAAVPRAAVPRGDLP